MEQTPTKTKNVFNHIFTILLFIAIPLFIISFAINIPIYFRPMYYWSIGPMNIVEEACYTYEEIVDSYNKLMDFLCFHKEFSLGVFEYSEGGRDHFFDCQVLFDLDTIIMWVTFIYILVIYILDQKKIVELKHYKTFSPFFYGALITVLLPFLVTIPLFIDFEDTFIFFHKILFPGKDNYYFSPYTDPIINALPENYFFLCMIVIGSAITILVAITLTLTLIKRKKKIPVSRI